MIDGEILETLWAVLNHTSKSIRTATLANRAETLDDHMIDSNWKKLVGIGESEILQTYMIHFNVPSVKRTIKKYIRAAEESESFQKYFADLTAASPPQSVSKWTKEIEQAEQNRCVDPSSMNVMRPNIPKRRPNFQGQEPRLNLSQGQP